MPVTVRPAVTVAGDSVTDATVTEGVCRVTGSAAWVTLMTPLARPATTTLCWTGPVGFERTTIRSLATDTSDVAGTVAAPSKTWTFVLSVPNPVPTRT